MLVDWPNSLNMSGKSYNNIMSEEKVQKPLTLNELAKYNQKVLLPAIDFRIDELKEELVTKKEFNKFKDKIYRDIDCLIKKVNKLLIENEIRNYQEKKQKEFFAIIVKSLKEHNILSQEQLEKIAHLDIF